MPVMLSKVAHRYGGRELAAGETFEADPRLVRVLIATGRAEVVRDDCYQTTAVAAASRAKSRGKRH